MKKIIIATLIGLTVLFILGCEADTENTMSEIEISIDDFIIADNGRYNFGDVMSFKTRKIIGTITNNGTSDLYIDGDISISGTESSLFSITAQPDSIIAVGESSAFVVLFSSSGASLGSKSAALSITSNSGNETNLNVGLTAIVTERVWIEENSYTDWASRIWFGSLVYDDKMWVLGGSDPVASTSALSDVWYSSDGYTWTEAADSTAWGERRGFATAVYDDKIWVMGGGYGIYYNDVWYSDDGASWTRATENAGWCERWQSESVVYDDKMWILGGVNSSYSSYNDVWYSEDGVEWNEITPSPVWGPRGSFKSLVYDDKIWVMGGSSGEDLLNDVWCSDDGVNWKLVTSSANWSKRGEFATAVYDDKMWVIGGVDEENGVLNDVWYSDDGINWAEPDSNTDIKWDSRFRHKSIVYDDKIWLLGGSISYPYSYSTGGGTEVWSW